MTANVVMCRSCGTDLRPNAKFCDECGVSTAAPLDPPQYKQVTVLFADVVRSMDIAASVDIERLREIITELVECSAAVVRRYDGTVEYNGDGVMALFGAPVALEDHAYRGCLAALAIQEQADRLAAEVSRRDGVSLRLRVGLNSGQVIAGQIGAGTLGYAAIGEHVGMAERIQSAAPPGGVMLSESTARLVEDRVLLSDPEWVLIKGATAPVAARRLIRIDSRHRSAHRAEAGLVGRRREMASLTSLLDRALGGRGTVANVVGPPGIGKSRLAREVATLAARRGADVFWAFCESHAADVPFHAVTRLLKASNGVADLDDVAARERLRVGMPPDADPQDLLLLDDLLGVADPNVALPHIDPDARRRRLTALLNRASLARTGPALFIIEDAHWVDAISESMMADLMAVIARTSAMVLITSRPEYDGALTQIPDAHVAELAALDDSDTTILLRELLGTDSSVTQLAGVIADRASGNPFFVEEMVRELAQRGVLTGDHGRYLCHTNAAEVAVPATVQAAIGTRIDRLSAPARRVLHAASVIGARFDGELLAALDVEVVVEELVDAELIEQVGVGTRPEYAFRHPLIRAVAYESQLKSDRTRWHLLVANVIRDRGSLDENASLIAEHLESAGDLHAAYGWQMRSGGWSSTRDLRAARLGWERARRIADLLPDDEPDRLSMRIAPRTMLCATDWQTRPVQKGWGRFAELRDLCEAADDKVSLAIGMTGLASELLYTSRAGEGSRLASEQMELLESIGDPNLTAGLAFVGFANWFNSGEFGELLRWTQRVIDLAAGDPALGGGFGVGSPLAVALAFRGIARFWFGCAGWRQDLSDAVALGSNSDAATFALTVAWSTVASDYGVVHISDAAVRTAEEASRSAQRSGNDFAVTGALFTLSAVLLHRADAADRSRGLELMVQAHDTWLPDSAPSLVQVASVWIARERARNGDLDAAISDMRDAVDISYDAGKFGWAVPGITTLVETLLERGSADDLAEAENHIGKLVDLQAEQDSAILHVLVLRLSALLLRARGDTTGFAELVRRYRDTAESFGFEAHHESATAMEQAGFGGR